MAAGAVGTPSKLISSPINIASLRDDAKAALEGILADLPGKICLAVDPRLLSPLKLVVTEGSRWMKERRVESVVDLTTPVLTTTCDSVLYLTRPAFPLMKLISAQAKSFDKRGLRKHLVVAFVPRRTFVCEQFLKDEGVCADVTIAEFGLDVYPLDDDVLTMGLDTCFRDAHVAGDHTSLFFVTRALLKMQSVYGLFPQVRAKGPKAKHVVEMFLRLQREEDGVTDASTLNSGGGGRAGASSIGAGGSGGAEKNSKGGSSGGAGNMLDGTIPEGTVIYIGPKGVSTLNSSSSSGTTAGGGGGGAGGSPPSKSEIDMLIILDRAVDLVTPLVTPLTVEGLLHEYLGIDNAMLQIDASLVATEEDDASTAASTAASPASSKVAPPKPALPPGSKLMLHLNSNDKLYTEIRDLHITTAGPHLTSRAKELQGFREQLKKNRNSLQISEIHKFVKALPTLQQDIKGLRILIELATLIKDATNDAAFSTRWALESRLLEEDGLKEVNETILVGIAKRTPLLKTLRLLCLDSVIEGGIKKANLEAIKKDMVAVYGFQVLPTLDNLERTGLLSSRDSGIFTSGSSSTWSALRKALSLVMDCGNVDAPTDFHFVTSGYAPLSVRLIQAAVTSGWTRDSGIVDALRILPGPTMQFSQVRRSDSSSSSSSSSSRSNAAADADGEGAGARKVVLVTFIGGVTYIEIASLRFLSEKFAVDFIILTTSIISGSSLLSTMVVDTPNAIATAKTKKAKASSTSSSSNDAGSGAKANTAPAAASSAKGGAATATSSAAAKASSSSSSASTKGAGSGGGGGLFGFGGKK